MPVERRPYSIAGAFLIALVVSAVGLLTPDALRPPRAVILASVVLPMFVIFGMPFCYWLPTARAAFFGGGMWRVPSQTLLLSRLLVCLIATTMIGSAIGTVFLGIVVDYRYLILGLGQTLASAAFIFSAARRFGHHPLTEFVMPSFFRLRGLRLGA